MRLRRRISTRSRPTALAPEVHEPLDDVGDLRSASTSIHRCRRRAGKRTPAPSRALPGRGRAGPPCGVGSRARLTKADGPRCSRCSRVVGPESFRRHRARERRRSRCRGRGRRPGIPRFVCLPTSLVAPQRRAAQSRRGYSFEQGMRRPNAPPTSGVMTRTAPVFQRGSAFAQRVLKSVYALARGIQLIAPGVSGEGSQCAAWFDRRAVHPLVVDRQANHLRRLLERARYEGVVTALLPQHIDCRSPTPAEPRRPVPSGHRSPMGASRSRRRPTLLRRQQPPRSRPPPVPRSHRRVAPW